MNGGASRRRLGLVLTVTLVAAVFAMSSIHGQGPRPSLPPRPGGIPGGITGGMPGGITGGTAGGLNGGITGGMPGGIRGGMPGGITGGNPGGFTGGRPGGGILGGGPRFEFKCSGCGKVVGQGNSSLDAPASCPFCGVRFINGGIGRGGPPAGTPGMTPPGNPGILPKTGLPGPPPTEPIKPVGGASAPPASNPAPTPDTGTSTASTEKSGNGRTIAFAVGLIVVALLILVGGTVLMIVSLKSSGKSGRKRRRRSEDD